MSMSDESTLDRAAAAIAAADAILIGAGAGMGVDSGLPDFRGPQGFWRAYPPYERLGLHFTAVANPRWFVQDPELAWGFYGHRMGLYRRTEPHEGFATLGRWAERQPRGGFVYTSNVDGHFHRGGFDPDRIVEVHGAIAAMQCMADCGVGIFPSDPYEVAIDEETMRARAPAAGLPELRYAGTPEYPHVRRWRLGFVAVRRPASPAGRLAAHARQGRCRHHRAGGRAWPSRRSGS